MNSAYRKEQKKANEEISFWINTTHISYFFREIWGNDSDNKKKANEYLHHAQLLERKFNDQYIIKLLTKQCNKKMHLCVNNTIVFSKTINVSNSRFI